MAKLGEQLGKFGDDGRNALKAIIQAPKNAWLQLRGKGEFAASAATAAEKSGGVVSALTYLPKKSAKAALWVIEQPFAWAVKAARGGTKLIGGAYKKAPLLMVPLLPRLMVIPLIVSSEIVSWPLGGGEARAVRMYGA